MSTTIFSCTAVIVHYSGIPALGDKRLTCHPTVSVHVKTVFFRTSKTEAIALSLLFQIHSRFP